MTSFSKQGGEDGYFSVTLADNLEDNPYVVLDVAEKQVIQNCTVSMKKGSKGNLADLFMIVKEAADSVEANFIKKLSHEVGKLDECPSVKEYKEFLKANIVKSGLGTFDEGSKGVAKATNRRTSSRMMAQKTQTVQEAKQERKGMSLEELDRILGGS
ncbi:hypothetical protein RJP21_29190 [Paenibacillus sp. VCA1]|uniref:hypothetical protein n=1 Tax=Paenibacillus sp. VCA1 TaxID=3039148 RepID=UPI0028719CD8|nr:hypothetical protein [Paenibacillus sp. VCA1]MDR9857670.1 hypothetical protein [Paenibacillus sp. VCA1]